MRRAGNRSLKTAIAAVSASAGIAVVILAVLFVGQVHKRVLWGRSRPSQQDGRRMEWQLECPKSLRTGYATVLETREPSLVSIPPAMCFRRSIAPCCPRSPRPAPLAWSPFFEIFLASIRTGSKRYLTDLSWEGSAHGGLAASLTAYTTYRLVLTVNENGLLTYVLVACVMALNFDFLRRKASVKRGHIEGSTSSSLRGIGLAAAFCARLLMRLSSPPSSTIPSRRDGKDKGRLIASPTKSRTMEATSWQCRGPGFERGSAEDFRLRNSRNKAI